MDLPPVDRGAQECIGAAAADRLPEDYMTAGTIVYLYAGHRALEERDGTTGDLRKRTIWSGEGLDTLLRVDDFTINTGPQAGEPVTFFFTTDRMGSPTAALVADEATGDAVVVERYAYDMHGRLFATPGQTACRRTDVDCDGLVGATDLALVRNALTPSAPAGTREDVCGNPQGDPHGAPDGEVDAEDVACVRADLGLGLDGLYTTATEDPDPAALPRPDKAFSLHGLTYDHATGLVFARARLYHPKLARWMARDPKGYVDGGNLYEAFGSNPARFTDPMGTALGDWWDPCTYTTTFGEALDDVIFIPLSEAIAAVNLENETTPTFVGDVLIILHELPARAVVSREATLAASHKRDVDCGFLHITRLWAGHHSGVNSMWDGAAGYDWYSGREIHGVERVATFSGGLSAAAGWAAMGTSAAPGVSSTARATTLRGLQWGAKANLPLPKAVQPALRSFTLRLALNEGAHQFALKTPQAAAQAGLAWSRGGTGLTSGIGFSGDAAWLSGSSTARMWTAAAGEPRPFLFTEKAGVGPTRVVQYLQRIPASQANAPFTARGWNAPYAEGTQVRLFTTGKDIGFVRVHGPANQQGAFLVRAKEISGMGPAQVQQHLALPYRPMFISDVQVPLGTRMQMGRVGAQPSFGAQNPSGIQYQLLDQIPSSSFTNTRPLP